MLDKNFQHLLQNEVSTEVLMITVSERRLKLQLKLVVVVDSLIQEKQNNVHCLSLCTGSIMVTTTTWTSLYTKTVVF